jgi:two-component system sensor histidine kinase CiaH
MIKKLRRKFVIINMSLVAVILCVVLGMFCFTRIHSFRAESEMAMRQMLDSSRSKEPPSDGNAPAPGSPNPATADSGSETDNSSETSDSENNAQNPQPPSLDFGPGGRNPAFNSVPVFLVTLDKNNEITDTSSSGSYTVTDTLSEAAVSAALAVSEDQGYLSDLKLRFIKQNTPEGTKIAFADTVQETRALGELVIQCVIMLLLFLLCFLLVSIFLARWALRPVETAWEQQNQFIADASHELKTPLTVILANLRILLSHKDATIREELQWVESTQEETGRMKKLVENLLFLARSDARSTPMVYSTFSFSDLILGCLLTFEPVAFEQGVMIEDHISEDISLAGDASQIRQLVAILLDNACKYAGNATGGETDDKKVTVTLVSENDRIRLTVHNTGKAIPEEDLPHLFERFYRTDKSRARTDGGYGLGLAIAQTIAKNHRGKITVVSAENLGTSFTVTLPVSKEKEHA